MTANEYELASLTPRQKLVAELVADGHTDKEIAALMHISPYTLRSFLTAIADSLRLDRTKNLRVQLAWLVIHDRHLADPSYRLKLPAGIRFDPEEMEAERRRVVRETKLANLEKAKQARKNRAA